MAIRFIGNSVVCSEASMSRSELPVKDCAAFGRPFV